ncbi:DUF2318 domain-containing protein [Geotalea sp. SG265]|uniref:DUF2318 domain-containing protein n=1 Tax=Geotalea sp. SG265 TaxID=2922867 RepID=UPI001FAFA2F9|nr:DUF2318 domain-containing protein [Geotalea sp. SG265]
MILARGVTMLLVWAILVMGLARAYAGEKAALTAGCAAGLVAGTIFGFFLFAAVPGEIPFFIIKSALAAAFISLFIVAAIVWYRGTAAEGDRPSVRHAVVAITVFLFAAGYGLLLVCRLPYGTDNSQFMALLLILLAMLGLWMIVYRLEPLLPNIGMAKGGTSLFAVSLLLFIASLSPRLDLFSPLSMKVMKLIHDFVHQFFESMLIPDHPFFRTDIWNYIGLLFSNGVGFWGGLAIWFIPTTGVTLATFREPLPSVAHVRQAAVRRKLIAAQLRERRRRLFFPLFAGLVMAAAAFNSSHPSVEYWDPKPLAVKADSAGEIVLPVKDGDVDLKDGKLHKYLYQKGAQKVRFFALYRSGELTVVLDACSICQPDGYGQNEGTVICYYCKTLIPLETVGKPGGCNPIPVPFAVDGSGVHLSAEMLVNTWVAQVQSEKKLPGGGK